MTLGKASCILLGLEVGWCAVVGVLLSVMHSGSFWSFNQSFMVLTMPVVGLLSIIGLVCGLAGSFTKNTGKTSSIIGAGVNAIVLLVVTLLAL
jgi:hypothetical protein